MTVLVLARDVDPSADRLVEALGERGVPVFRTDLAAFPQALTLDARPTTVHGSERDLGLLVRNLVQNAVQYTRATP